jgi:hypothetical protein
VISMQIANCGYRRQTGSKAKGKSDAQTRMTRTDIWPDKPFRTTRVLLKGRNGAWPANRISRAVPRNAGQGLAAGAVAPRHNNKGRSGRVERVFDPSRKNGVPRRPIQTSIGAAERPPSGGLFVRQFR